MARKQQEIPGTERPKIQAIDDAACEFREVRDRRMALSTQEKEKHQALLAKMREHGQESYKFEDDDGTEVSVFVESKEKVRVRKAKADGSEQDTPEGDEN